MTFNAALLEQKLAPYHDAGCFWVAYSGGCDSHALLHALGSIRTKIANEIKAVHINHGLSPFANEWERHCQDICEHLSVPYHAISVNVRADKTSPEEAARDARYAALAKLIKQDDVLLLAHHQDDQAETVLLQLLRGSGVKGLAAMPEQQTFHLGKLCRPLLDFTREELLSYALEAGLNWIDDPSNFDTDFDRNFLRHEVIPLLQTRWPALKKTLSRTAVHQAEADKLLTGLAQQDWLQIRNKEQLSVSALLELDDKRQRNVLRYWLASVCQLTLPDTVHLQRIMEEVLTAAEDALPEVIWKGGEVRRYQGQLYAQKSLVTVDKNLELEWPDLSQALPLGNTGLCLTAKAIEGKGLSQTKLGNRKVTVQYRQGGESCRPFGRGHTHPLKKLFQEWQIPPWLRNTVPLVFVDGELAAVVGYTTCQSFTATEGEPGWLIEQVNL